MNGTPAHLAPPRAAKTLDFGHVPTTMHRLCGKLRLNQRKKIPPYAPRDPSAGKPATPAPWRDPGHPSRINAENKAHTRKCSDYSFPIPQLTLPPPPPKLRNPTHKPPRYRCLKTVHSPWPVFPHTQNIAGPETLALQ